MRATGAEMDIITWNTIAGGCLKTGNFIGALKLFSQMRSCGIQLEPVATLIGLGACSHTGLLKNGKEIHGLVIRSHLDHFDNVRNALINMYARCKALKQAHILFQFVDSKTVITWNTIISGFAHWDRSEETSFLFREMLLSGVEPNYITIAGILPLCARVANLQHGKEFHCYLTRREGFEEHLLLWNSLVDMYARSGKNMCQFDETFCFFCHGLQVLESKGTLRESISVFKGYSCVIASFQGYFASRARLLCILSKL
ncbi:hypothetical protein K7X08_025267 [Anisodus acutangulus]|uniref:Pentatricopeptide repeat-containing protein n=1 Tax=Anisodus acutangulus TaxID=402998 RepID=A0A9Q1R7K4_9SOLA|nr:hypothetical protein K7X08_025267 [Anisodus acutangulus]